MAQRPDGRLIPFYCSGGACTTDSDIGIRLAVSSTGSYTLTDLGDTVEQYNAGGVLLSIQYRGGYTQTLTYNASTGLASSLSDSLGRTLGFIFNPGNQLQTLTTPDGNIQYSYTNENLTSVTHPDGSIRTYQYTNTSNPNALTSVIDESSNAYVSTTYDSQGRAVSSGLAGGVLTSSINYTNPASPIVTDAFGVARTYHYTTINGQQKITSITGSPCLTCNAPAAITYDTAGYYQSMTDWNGNLTNYTYDDSRGLELSRTEAVGTAQQRTISTTWNASFRLPSEIDEPGRKTVFGYDSAGNLLTRTVTDTATNASRTWSYSNYTAWGAPQTITGPRTDLAQVTSIAYYPIVSGDPKSGQISTITDALGHVTTVDSYDPSGRPLQVTDANGLVTTLAYSPRGWLTSRQAGTELTQYSYYPTGLLQQVTLPNGATLQYTYNAAHQLTQVQDQLGDKIVYTPDAMGNNTATQVYDPNGTLTQTRSRVYNSLNELYQDIGAQSQTTTYGYDNNGNVTSVSDPLSHVTGNAYDALNRLTQVTDPANGVTHYGYNALDQLTGVTDPRTLVTAYTVDALGNTGALQSPDSGSTSATYDAAGNVLTRTDAKNQTSHYQYDALNRLTQVTRADSTVVGFSYDQGTNGIGRLTGMSDPSGTTAWSYDAHGRVLQKTQVTGGVTLSTAYSYDSSGRLSSQTLPSGAVIGYTWSNGQVSALKLNNAALASSLVWQPFSGPKSWSFANGESISRGYDQDGRIASTAVESSVGYDSASRINGITLGNLSLQSGNKTYGYDALDRLNSYADAITGITYGYDANGNRNTQTLTPALGQAATTSFTIDTASNRLTGINGSGSLVPISLDANGSTTQDANGSYAYDAAGHLASLSSAYSMSAPASYGYDGLGQRVSKTVGSTTTLYAYDEAHHLIGEYSSAGAQVNETVWLGDLPLAAIQPSGTYYIHTDHLNAPRQIDNASKQAVWTWDTMAFGQSLSNQDPNGTGTPFIYNLRFPGQYYDQESGLYYNLNRYYDSALGRYIGSDPMGLAGGSFSTFAYVGDNPISYVDALGLDPGGRGSTRYDPDGRDDRDHRSDRFPDPPPPPSDEHCEEEIQSCVSTCQRARNDSNQKGVWAGSWWRCMAGCVSHSCQSHIDPVAHGDPECH